MSTAAILFAIAALGGVTMAVIRFRGNPAPPLWLAAVHGLVAAAGLVTLIATVTRQNVPATALVSLAGFLVAALGGFLLLLGFHLKGKPLPVPVMLLHGTVAVISFVTLLIAIFGVQ